MAKAGKATPAKRDVPVKADTAVFGPPWPPPMTAVPAPAERITFSQVHEEKPEIAITFDDGPHPVNTPRLLAMLRERKIKATFFVLGNCVQRYPDVLKQIEAEGHEIGNHSWNHPLLNRLAEPKVFDELKRTDDIINETLGHRVTLMRPPYGALTTPQRSWVNRVWDYRIVLWDVDSMDWQHRNMAKTQSTILDHTKAGSIILCHDIHATTIDAMPATLDALIAKGFQFTTVSDLISHHVEPPAKALPVRKGVPAAPGSTPAAPGATPAAAGSTPPTPPVSREALPRQR